MPEKNQVGYVIAFVCMASGAVGYLLMIALQRGWNYTTINSRNGSMPVWFLFGVWVILWAVGVSWLAWFFSTLYRRK